MLFRERVLHAAKASPDGCFGYIYRRPANAYRPVVLILSTKNEQITLLLSQSIIQPHHTRTLSNNRRTLSLTPREKCVRNCFAKHLTLRKRIRLSSNSYTPFIRT